MKSFDIVKAVVQAAADDLSDKYVINSENLDILSSYCDVIDDILKECFGSKITADITEDNHVSIEIVLSSFVYETKFKPKAYIDLIERANKINFKQVDEDSLSMEFIFPSVFDEV